MHSIRFCDMVMVILLCEVVMIKKTQKLLTDTCILFTVLAFVLFGIGSVSVEYAIALSFSGTVLLFCTALMLALCSRIFSIKKLHMAFRVLLHYVAVLAASFLIFAVIGKIVSTSLATLVLLSVITLLYSVIAFIYALWKTRYVRKGSKDYTSLFKK